MRKKFTQWKAGLLQVKKPVGALSEELLKKLPFDTTAQRKAAFTPEEIAKIQEQRNPKKDTPLTHDALLQLEHLATEEIRAAILDKRGSPEEYKKRVEEVLATTKSKIDNARRYVRSQYQASDKIFSTRVEIMAPNQDLPKEGVNKIYFYKMDDKWQVRYFEPRGVDGKKPLKPVEATVTDEALLGFLKKYEEKAASQDISTPEDLKLIDKSLGKQNIRAGFLAGYKLEATSYKTVNIPKIFDDAEVGNANRPFDQQWKACQQLISEPVEPVKRTSVSSQASVSEDPVERLADQLKDNLTYAKEKALSQDDAEKWTSAGPHKKPITNTQLMAVKTYETNLLKTWLEENKDLPMGEFIKQANEKFKEAEQHIQNARAFTNSHNQTELAGKDGTAFIEQTRRCNSILIAAAAKEAFEPEVNRVERSKTLS